MFQYKYPRPSVTCDIIVVAKNTKNKKDKDPGHVLLIKRATEPFKGKWALPGGFVDENEDLPVTASRELFEETGLENLNLIQIGAFGKPGRDPRGHTITIVYLSLVECKKPLSAGDDADEAQWFSIEKLPELAFDHSDIIEFAMKKLSRNNAVF